MAEHHIVPARHYFYNFAALAVLMTLTVVASRMDMDFIFHGCNLVIALAIAITKATLIVLIFMDVRHGSHLTWLFAGAGFFWFMILICVTLVDMYPGTHASMGSPYTTAIPPVP